MAAAASGSKAASSACRTVACQSRNPGHRLLCMAASDWVLHRIHKPSGAGPQPGQAAPGTLPAGRPVLEAPQLLVPGPHGRSAVAVPDSR